MKTFTLLATSMLFMHLMMAQPVLQNNLNFTLGDTYRLNSYNEVFNIVPGPPGTNMVWDFEVIEGDYFAVGNLNVCVDPSTTLFADSAEVMLSDIAISTLPTEPFDPFIYYYVKSGNTNREYLAMGMYLDGHGTYGSFRNAWVDLQYPMTYGNGFDFEVETLLFGIYEGFYYLRDSAEVTVEADAWGSITTPAGLFASVLRLKTTEITRSWMKYDINQPWIYLGEFTYISYHWFAPNIKVPVMVIHEFDFKKEQALAGSLPQVASINNPLANRKNGRDGLHIKETEYSAVYLAEYNFYTGIAEINTAQIRVYPLPAKDKVYISHEKDIEITEYRIYSIDGRLVSSSNDVAGYINVSNLKPGAYLLNLYAVDALVGKEKIIIHR